MNKDFITYTIIVLAVSFSLAFIVSELFKPVSSERQYEIIEQQRVEECQIKLGGTVYEKGCNEMYYQINQDVD